MDNDLQKTLDFYKKRVEELEKVVVEINKSKFDKLMEKDILFHLKKELEEKDKEYTRLHNELKLKCEYIREIVAIKDEYKQKLNTQPKEIVEKIKHFIGEDACGYEEEQFAKDIAEYLDKILKEY